VISIVTIAIQHYIITVHADLAIIPVHPIDMSHVRRIPDRLSHPFARTNHFHSLLQRENNRPLILQNLCVVMNPTVQFLAERRSLAKKIEVTKMAKVKATIDPYPVVRCHSIARSSVVKVTKVEFRLQKVDYSDRGVPIEVFRIKTNI
jgi:hypothetical protein